MKKLLKEKFLELAVGTLSLTAAMFFVVLSLTIIKHLI